MMIQLARTIAVLVGGAACASAFTGPMGVTSFSGVRVTDNVDTISSVPSPPARRSVVTPRMGGKENAIRLAVIFRMICVFGVLSVGLVGRSGIIIAAYGGVVP